MNAEMENICLRVSKLEVKMEEVSKQIKPKEKKKHERFQCPDNINKELYNRLVSIRKEFVSNTGKQGLNLVFNGARIVSIIRAAVKSMDDMKKIKGIGENNMQYAEKFLEALNPVPEPASPPRPPTPAAIVMSQDKTKELVVKAKAKKKF